MDKPQEEITLLLAEIAAGSLAQWCAPDIDKFLKIDLDFLLNLRWARACFIGKSKWNSRLPDILAAFAALAALVA